MKNRMKHRSKRRAAAAKKKQAFTLLEVLLAFAMFALLVTALQSLLFSSFRLVDRANQTSNRISTRAYVENILRRDLISTVTPGGILQGEMICSSERGMQSQQDRFEFYTASNPLNMHLPWSDVQKVIYSVQPAQRSDGTRSQALVRTTVNNLLTTTQETSSQEYLMPDVNRLEFSFFDGSVWQQAWDSTIQDPSMPIAIRARVDWLNDESTQRKNPPLVITVPLVSLITNENAIATDAQSEEESSDNSENGPNGPEMPGPNENNNENNAGGRERDR